MRKVFSYKIGGSGADGQTWEVEGRLVCEYPQVFDAMMNETMDKLTNGQAVFGRPGVGCRGPYDIDSVEIRQVRQ